MIFNKLPNVFFILLMGLIFSACTDSGSNDNSASAEKEQCAQPGTASLQSVLFKRTVNNQTDLYLANEDGSGLVTIANSSDNEDFQAISPSNQIIFSQDINGSQLELFSIDINGNNKIALTDTLGLVGSKYFAAISPSSGRIIFHNKPTNSTYHLYSVDASGTDLKTISATGNDDFFNRFTKNGLLIFNGYHMVAQFQVGDLFSFNEATNEIRTLSSASNNKNFIINETDDGRIIYDSWPYGPSIVQADVYSVRLDGTDRKLLAGDPSVELCRDIATMNVAGIKTTWAIIQKEKSPGSGDWDLVSADVNGTTVNADGTISGQATLVDTTSRDFFIAKTSRGRVIYSSEPAYDLFSINADGTDPRVLANSADRELFQAITAQEKIIYKRSYDNIQNDLHIVNPDCSGNSRLTNTAEKNAEFLHEAANGRIIFRASSTANSKLYGFYSIKADGTGFRTLVNDSTNSVYFIDETPSGRLIFVESTNDPYYNMFSVDASCNELTNLADKVNRFSYKGETANGRIIFDRLDPNDTSLYDIYSVNADGSDLVPIANSVDDEIFLKIF